MLALFPVPVFVRVIMTTVFIWVTRVIRVTSAHCSPLALILVPAFSSLLFVERLFALLVLLVVEL